MKASLESKRNVTTGYEAHGTIELSAILFNTSTETVTKMREAFVQLAAEYVAEFDRWLSADIEARIRSNTSEGR